MAGCLTSRTLCIRGAIPGILLLAVCGLEGGPRWRGWETTLRADLSGGYDTQPSANSSGESSFVYRGGLNLDLRQVRSDADWDISLGSGLLQFSDLETDTDPDFRVRVSTKSNRPRFGSRVTGGASVEMNRANQEDPLLGERIQNDRFSAGGNLLLSPNTRYSLGLNASYSADNPSGRSENIAGVTQAGLGLTGYHRRSEKLAFTLAGNFSANRGSGSSVSGGDSEFFSLSLGMDGQISPKLSGVLQGGWQVRDGENLEGDSGSPYLNAALTWAMNARTQVGIRANSGFSSTVGSQNSEQTSLTLDARRTINTRLSGNLTLNFNRSKVVNFGQEREQDLFSVAGGVSFRVNQSLSMRGNLQFSQQTSNEATFDFDRWLGEVGLQYTY